MHRRLCERTGNSEEHSRPHQVFTPSAPISPAQPMSLTQLTQRSHGHCPHPSSDENGSGNTCSIHKKRLRSEPAGGREGKGIANTRQDEHARRMSTTHQNWSSSCNFNTGGGPILRTKSDAQFGAKYLYPHCGGTAVWPQKVVPKNEGFLGSRNHLNETLPLDSHIDLHTKRHEHKSTCKD